MIDGLPFADLDGIGVVGFSVLAVLAFMTGRVFSKRQYDDVVHDRDEWRTAHRISEAARLEDQGHKLAMTETATMLNQLMREMQDRLRRSKALDGGDDA